jgi:predicted ester cyclase
VSEQDNRRIIEEALAAANAHDIGRYLKHLDDSHIWENDAFPAPLRGREEARRALTAYFAAFPDVRWETEQVIASGDYVVVCSRMTGTHKGEFRGPGALGIPPTNKQFSSHSCTVTEVRNGRAVKTITYADRLATLQQLGALPLGKTAATG